MWRLLERSDDSIQHLERHACLPKKVIAWIVVQIVFKNVPGPKATVVMLELYGSASKIVQYSS